MLMECPTCLDCTWAPELQLCRENAVCDLCVCSCTHTPHQWPTYMIVEYLSQGFSDTYIDDSGFPVCLWEMEQGKRSGPQTPAWFMFTPNVPSDSTEHTRLLEMPINNFTLIRHSAHAQENPKLYVLTVRSTFYVEIKK